MGNFFSSNAGSLISAGGGLFGSLIGGLFGNSAQKSANRTNLQIARENNQANRELAEYSYSKELEQWNRQNEYNTPLAQMQRYADAGLNPNLIYGQGSNGNATSSPSYPTPKMEGTRVQPVDALSSSFGQIGQILGQFSNYKLTEAQIRTQEALTNKYNNEAAFINSKNSYQGLFNSYFGEYAPLSISNLRNRNSLLGKEIGSFDKKIGKLIADTDYVKALTTSVNNKNSIFDSISVPILLAQLSNIEEHTKGLKIDNKTRNALHMADLAIKGKLMRMYDDSHYIDRERYDGLWLDNGYKRRTLGIRVKGAKLGNINSSYNNLLTLERYKTLKRFKGRTPTWIEAPGYTETGSLFDYYY